MILMQNIWIYTIYSKLHEFIVWIQILQDTSCKKLYIIFCAVFVFRYVLIFFAWTFNVLFSQFTWNKWKMNLNDGYAGLMLD